MLTIEGKKSSPFCDGIPRRGFLKAGAMGLGFGGVTLADLLRIEAATGGGSSQKGVINVHLEGGPPQMDMWDMKPDAPSEYGGEFKPIQTTVAGLQICELMPRLAKLADKYSIIRSVVGNIPGHTWDTTQIGYASLKQPKAALRPIGGASPFGSIVTKMLGHRDGMPAYVWMKNGGSQEQIQPGFLGPLYRPFQPNAHISLFQRRIPEARLNDRVSLLKHMDRLRRDVDTAGEMAAMDHFTGQAMDMLASGKIAKALDLSQEDPKVRERYAAGQSRVADTERLLVARRLVEAGVRCVGLNWGGYLGFDSHKENYPMMRRILPPCDAALSTLIEDIYERGLDKDIAVIVWGEFGRSPKINDTKAGRDHWPPVQSAMIFGGGFKTGQIIGGTDRFAGEATSRPVHVHEVLSTLYHHLGIDIESAQLIDPNGRPRYLVDVPKPIGELL